MITNKSPITPKESPPRKTITIKKQPTGTAEIPTPTTKKTFIRHKFGWLGIVICLYIIVNLTTSLSLIYYENKIPWFTRLINVIINCFKGMK